MVFLFRANKPELPHTSSHEKPISVVVEGLLTFVCPSEEELDRWASGACSGDLRLLLPQKGSATEILHCENSFLRLFVLIEQKET